MTDYVTVVSVETTSHHSVERLHEVPITQVPFVTVLSINNQETARVSTGKHLHIAFNNIK